MAIYDKFKNNSLENFGIYNPLLTKKQRKEIKQMKKKVEKGFKLDDGKHEGSISAIETKTEPYEYVDIELETDKEHLKLKCGVPFYVTDNSALGKILTNFGADLEIDAEIDINNEVIKYKNIEIKKGDKVEFLTKTEKTDKGTFSRVIPDTLKPIK